MGRLTLFGAAAFFTSMLLTTSAAAGCLCGRWANNPAPLNVCVKVNDSGCADSALDAPVREAISRWNVFAPQWAFVDPPVDVNGPRDARNSLTFQTRAQVAARWGVAIPQNVLGVTFLFPVVGGPVGNQACPLPGGIRCPTFGDAADHDVDIVLLSEQRFTLDEERVYESFYGRLQPAGRPTVPSPTWSCRSPAIPLPWPTRRSRLPSTRRSRPTRRQRLGRMGP